MTKQQIDNGRTGNIFAPILIEQLEEMIKWLEERRQWTDADLELRKIDVDEAVAVTNFINYQISHLQQKIKELKDE